jgi:hypothetical protein
LIYFIVPNFYRWFVHNGYNPLVLRINNRILPEVGITVVSVLSTVVVHRTVDGHGATRTNVALTDTVTIGLVLAITLIGSHFGHSVSDGDIATTAG